MPKRPKDADKLVELIDPVNDLIERAAYDLEVIYNLEIKKADAKAIWKMVLSLTKINSALHTISTLNKP